MAQVFNPGTAYSKPGTYIKQEFIPQVDASADFRRIPCYVGIGSDILLYENKAVKRGYVKDEALVFPNQAPFKSRLKYLCDGDKDNASLRTLHGEALDDRLWSFVTDELSDDVIGVTINSAAFDPSQTYVIDYQSHDNSVLDSSGIADLSKILEMGFQENNTDLLPEYYDLEILLRDFKVGSVALKQETNKGFGDVPKFNKALSKYVGPSQNYTVVVNNKETVNLPAMLNATAADTNKGSGTCTLNLQNWSPKVDTTYTFKVKEVSEGSSQITFEVTRNVPSFSDILVVKRGFESNVAILDGLIGDFGDLSKYVVDDTLTYEVGLRDKTLLEMSWFAEDSNGGLGEFNVSDLNREAVEWTSGLFLQFGADLDLYVKGDAWNVDVESTGNIKWRYDLETVEKISEQNIGQDKTGAVTGTRNAWFAQLKETRAIEISKVEVKVKAFTAEIPKEEWKFNPKTQQLVFNTKPAGTLTVYINYTRAPSFGQTYYLTAEARRPDAYYNKVLALTESNFREIVGYPSPDNHLAIMAELALVDVGVPSITIVQAKDADRDGKYTDADYRVAIQSSREFKAITDIIVLGTSESQGELFAELEIRNDPLRQSPTLSWHGYPVDTKVGSALQEEGTLSFYGGKVMKVPAGSNLAGSVLSVANSWGKRTISNRSNIQTEVTLDGTFLSGVLAAMNAKFTQPSESLLRKTVPGFSEIQTFDDVDLGVLGKKGFIFLEQNGDVIRVMDVTTHDQSAPDMKQLNAMNQKAYVTAVVTQRMNEAIVGITPDSQEDGETLVRNQLLQILQNLANTGIVGKYQDDSGAVRRIDATRDTWVQRDKSDPTQYYFRYAYFLKYHIARLFGSYRVDQDLLKS